MTKNLIMDLQSSKENYIKIAPVLTKTKLVAQTSNSWLYTKLMASMMSMAFWDWLFIQTSKEEI